MVDARNEGYFEDVNSQNCLTNLVPSNSRKCSTSGHFTEMREHCPNPGALHSGSYTLDPSFYMYIGCPKVKGECNVGQLDYLNTMTCSTLPTASF